LHLGIVALEIIMHDVEVLERRKLAVRRQRRLHEELDFAAAGAQPVAGIDAQFLAHALDHPADFRLKILRIVDNVKVRVAHPGGRGLVVELASELDTLRATRVFLCGIEFLGAIRSRNHMDDLVVSGQHERKNERCFTDKILNIIRLSAEK